MSKRMFTILLAVAVLFSAFTACGGQLSAAASASAAQGSASSPSETPASAPEPSPPPAETPSSSETSGSDPSMEPAEVDLADHVFPDLEAFFNRAADESRSNDARGWKYSFEKLRPYDQLETVEAELIALLQEPRWQLELVDQETVVFESGDINPVDTYYFQYTGTAELTEIRDVLGVRLDNVIVTVYHVPIHGYYDVSVWCSPELEAVDPGCQVSAETDAVDPASKLLPDIGTFLYRSPSTSKKYGDHGYQHQWNGSHPFAAYETVSQELLDLLTDGRYQLKLREQVLNPHYGIPVYDYYFDYTGTSGEITKLTDKYEEYEFHVSLSFFLYPDEGYFKITLKFSRGFDLEDPGKRTTRNIEPGSDGGVLAAPPESDDDGGSDFWKKCSACHGSGKCTHCNGKGEVRKFQAGLGWVEQDCTLCNRGKCRHCNGTGKD